MAERSPGVALSPSERATMRDLLGADRERTMARVASLTQDWDDIVESSALVGADDEHDPEGSSTAFERAHIQSLLHQAEKHLADLDTALERLDDGTYGVCEGCGRAIAVERLKARPAARTCITCASAVRH
ncbi:TraR/DksA family transcriptional regulator [Sphaerisporangium album]|uniref:TraR/DksA family transcriptional regulator n=1 Tax=Sphaerisporangium album TaxID=509200 RepID=A0A367F4W4_9ACTN|nr:TraR/DksA C4-type zinc finger protein [Sphaerisporangium album]RCG25406.1 TraR/DksA family transcriptional regulator [Sphaerisporangium album]